MKKSADLMYSEELQDRHLKYMPVLLRLPVLSEKRYRPQLV